MDVSIRNRDTGAGENIPFWGDMEPLTACHTACSLHNLRDGKDSGAFFPPGSGYEIIKFSQVFWSHYFGGVIHPPASGDYLVKGKFVDARAYSSSSSFTLSLESTTYIFTRSPALTPFLTASTALLKTPFLPLT